MTTSGAALRCDRRFWRDSGRLAGALADGWCFSGELRCSRCSDTGNCDGPIQNPEIWDRLYLESGGLPGLMTVADDPASRLQYLEAILDSIVLRDVVARHKLRDTELLRRILLFVADNIGSPVSARSIAGVLKNQRRPSSVESIYNYLDHLVEAFVIHPAPYFDLRGKRLLETGGKWYFADLGLRHALVGYRAGDVGQFLENIVFIELKHRGWTVSVGRVGEFEVDFVASRTDEKIYIQVAYLTPDKETLERELRPLQAISDNYPKYLLTLDPLGPSRHDGIIQMPVEEFLIDNPASEKLV